MLPGGRGEEFVIIAAIALIVVGPKDLPKLLRQVGRFVGKMRRMADEFRTSFEDMARQSELDDLRKEVDALRASKIDAPGFDDLHNEMRSIGSDIKSSLTSSDTPAMSPVMSPAEATVTPPPSDPQMEGLPPKAAETVVPEIVIKKARPRKSVTIADTAPPATEPDPATPAKRQPRKKVST